MRDFLVPSGGPSTVHHRKTHLQPMGAEMLQVGEGARLNTERGTAAASVFDIGVVKFEPGCFHGLNVIDHATVQIHQGCCVDEDLDAIELEYLVHHSSLVLKRHGVLETGAAAAHDPNAQPCRQWVLGGHDLPHLGARLGRKDDRLGGGGIGCRGVGGGCHGSFISGPKLAYSDYTVARNGKQSICKGQNGVLKSCPGTGHGINHLGPDRYKYTGSQTQEGKQGQCPQKHLFQEVKMGVLSCQQLWGLHFPTNVTAPRLNNCRNNAR